ncbi:MAG: TetR/AcrR family transcriptional regulator [Bacteroidota bacterium]|nr:TetR/AcrR family transcriptional regulator [Bacteroidota bacterium]
MHSESIKYKQLCLTGRELFWKHGVKRISVKEICHTANVSKMTFYKYFSNKTAFAKAILNDELNSAEKKFSDLVHANIPFSKKIEKLFLLKIESTNNISQEFIEDIYSNPQSELFEHMQKKSNEMQKKIENFYRKAQQDGNIRKDINIQFILSFSSHIGKLIMNKELMSNYDSPQNFIIESMNLLFHGILTNDE